VLKRHENIFYEESPVKKSTLEESRFFEDLVIKNTRQQISVFKSTDAGFEFVWSNEAFEQTYNCPTVIAKCLNFKVFRNFVHDLHDKKTQTYSLLDLLHRHLKDMDQEQSISLMEVFNPRLDQNLKGNSIDYRDMKQNEK
jgi:hypothetical protein